MIIGSPKKSAPNRNELPFTSIYGVTNSDARIAGASTAPNRTRAVLLWNGGVGDRALSSQLLFTNHVIGDILRKALPSVRDVTNDVHCWPDFVPHDLFDRLLRLVLRSS